VLGTATCIRRVARLPLGGRIVANLRHDFENGWLASSHFEVLVNIVRRVLTSDYGDSNGATLSRLIHQLDQVVCQGPPIPTPVPRLARASTIQALAEKNLSRPRRHTADRDATITISDINGDLTAGVARGEVRGRRPFAWASPLKDCERLQAKPDAADHANAAMALGFAKGTVLVLLTYRTHSPSKSLRKPTGIEGIGNPNFISASSSGWGLTHSFDPSTPPAQECVHLPVDFQETVETVALLGVVESTLESLTEVDFGEAFPNQPWDAPCWIPIRRGLTHLDP